MSVVILLASCGNDSGTGALFGSSGGTTSPGAGGAASLPSGAGAAVPGPGGGSSLPMGGAPGTGGAGPSLGGTSGAPGSGGVAGSKGGASNPDASVPGSDSGSDTDASSMSAGILPPIKDPTMTGPFTPTETDKTGPGMNYTIIAPKELGQGGIKNPILLWGPGAGAFPGIYQTLLNDIASHGFVVVSYNSTPQGPELTAAIDWLVTESKRQGSPYFGTIDTTKIAAGGQSAGSLATFKIANDPRLTTTVHLNGGTFAPHTDEMNLVKPALFVCGDDPSVSGGDGTSVSDLARPNCDVDFMNATTPVWYGDVIGASHTTVIDNPLTGKMAGMDPLAKQFFASTVEWLRWQLAGDQTAASWFLGPSCGFCMETMLWKVQQKNLK